jgi:diguanylate cyclase (GGDEF)-like protein/PAS domain S-box-containing protein
MGRCTEMLSPRLRRAISDQVGGARFYATLSMGPIAGLAIVALQPLGWVSKTPIWLIPAMLFVGLFFTYSAGLWWEVAKSRPALHARIASQAALVTAMIYATGWGPSLAVGLVLVGQESMTTIGVQAKRAVLGWSLTCLFAGEGLLALGWTPSLLPAREMNGLTLLMAIGIANAFRSLAGALVEKEQAAALTEQHERRFRALVQSSHDLVFVVAPDSVVTYASPSCAEVLGYEPAELLGNRTAGLLHADEVQSLREVLGQTARLPGANTEFSMRIRHVDGRWRTFEGIATNLLDDPAVLGLVINARDVTDRNLRHERQAAIAALGRDALAMTSLDEVMQACVSTIRDALDLRSCRVVDGDHVIEVEAGHTAAPESTGETWRIPVGDPALPVAHVDIVSAHRVSTDDHQFVESVAGIMLSSIVRDRAEQVVRHQAMHDPLTALPNRSLFHDRLEHALTRSARSGGYLAVMIVDLDGFKTVNDSLGHLAGDALLIAVAQRFRTSLRDLDTVARLGGDEFAILVDDLETPEQAGRAAQRVLDALELPLELRDRSVGIGASIGIALARRRDIAPELLLSNADAAMYRAKREGKGCYRVFEAAMHTAAVERMELEQALRSAIAHEALTVHYQPVVETHTGRVSSFEALARWHDPVRGFIPPDTFIPLAEESGIIIDLGRRVLFEACRQAAIWRSSGIDDPPDVAVNVSRLQLANPRFVTDVNDALSNAGIEPSALTLEITESVFIGDSINIVAVLDDLRRVGVRIAIDDFGTGYSSFAALAELPIDDLKIDKTFIDKLLAGSDGRGFVYAILQLAHTLHLETTAEGVEETGQFDELRRLGCTHIQGYLFAKPMPAAEAEEYLRSRQAYTSNSVFAPDSMAS